MYECDWWNMYKTDNIVKQHLRKSLPYKTPLGEKKFFWIISNLEVYLVMFNVILKYPKIFEKLLPTFRPSSRTLTLVERTLVHLRKIMPKEKEPWFSLGNAKIKLHLGEGTNHYTAAALLFGLQKKLSLRAIHSIELLQQLCSVCSEG